jgi:hypothetical protein
MMPRKKPKHSYKKPASVKHLESMMDANYSRLHPSLPVIQHNMRDDTANGLTKCITTYMKLKGHYVTRIASQGTYSVKLGRYIPGTARRGIADIEMLVNGVFIAVEVKVGKDRQSEDQKSVESDINKSGGHYFIARDFTGFVEWLSNLE